jgi:hypothetical protein
MHLLRTPWLLAALCLAVASASATPPDTLWTRTYGGHTDEQIRCIARTADGGSVFSGSAAGIGPSLQVDAYVGRIDANGDTLWTTTFGGPGSDVGYAVRATQDDGFIVAGMSEVTGFDDRDVYLVKLDANGDIEWQETYGGSEYDEARDVQVLVGDGGYIITGYTRSFGAYGSDVYMIRTTATGDTIATNHFDYSINDVGMSVCETMDAYVVCGHSQSATDHDLLMMQTTTHLEFDWAHEYGGAGHDVGFSVALALVDFGFFVGGETSSFGAGDADGWVLRTDASGDTLWTRTIGDELPNRFFANVIVADGGCVFAGQHASVPFEDRKVLAAKVGDDGTVEWETTYGPPGEECLALSLDVTIDGDYVLAGHLRETSGGDFDAYVIRLEGDSGSGIAPPTPARAAPPVVVYPNPSAGAVTLAWQSPAVSLAGGGIFDCTGRLLAHAPSQPSGAAGQLLRWDGLTPGGQVAPPGVYFYRLRFGQQTVAGRLIRTR